MLDKWCEEYEAGNYCLENEETTAAFFWGGFTPTLSKTITFKASELFEKSIKSRSE